MSRAGPGGAPDHRRVAGLRGRPISNLPTAITASRGSTPDGPARAPAPLPGSVGHSSESRRPATAIARRTDRPSRAGSRCGPSGGEPTARRARRPGRAGRRPARRRAALLLVPGAAATNPSMAASCWPSRREPSAAARSRSGPPAQTAAWALACCSARGAGLVGLQACDLLDQLRGLRPLARREQGVPPCRRVPADCREPVRVPRRRRRWHPGGGPSGAARSPCSRTGAPDGPARLAASW